MDASLDPSAKLDPLRILAELLPRVRNVRMTNGEASCA
jgi:hypothetical protein